MTLKILPEIEENLFPLKPEELNLLEESILSEGVRDALVVWPKDGELILVDGHNRYRIAKEHNIPFEIKEKHFNDLDEVLEWVDFNQLGRRNLIDEQRSYVLGRLYERRKKQGERKDIVKEGSELKVKLTLSLGSNATAKEIAKQAGVGEKTVRRAADFAVAVDKVKKIDPEAAGKILQGEVVGAITHLPKIVKKNPEILPKLSEKIKQTSVPRISDIVKNIRKEELKEQREKLLQTVEAIPKSDKYEILIGDMSVIQLDKKFDFIITDPPYPKEYLPLYEVLAKRSREWLKDDGLLIVMCGQSYVDQILQMMTKYISYYWTCAYLTPGQPTPLRQRQVNSSWKPVFVFGKESYSGKIFGDVFKSDIEDKSLHEWQQSVSGMLSVIRQFCLPGQSVLDPFCGTGTTGVAALTYECTFTGVEIDPKTAEIAGKRLKLIENDKTKI